MWCTALWLTNIAHCIKGNALHWVSDWMIFILWPLLPSLTLSIKGRHEVYNCWHRSQPPQGKLKKHTCQATCASTDWVCMSLHLFACDFRVCLLVRAPCLCVYHSASVCTAAVNSLWLNHKLRVMRECCQFSTGEGLIHSVSDAINQIKHPSALLEEFL